MNLLKTLQIKLAQMNLDESENVKELLDYSGQPYQDTFDYPYEDEKALEEKERLFFKYTGKELSSLDHFSDYFPILGSGAFRRVYDLDNGLVLKVSPFGDEKMNKEEFDLQYEFQGLLPKVYLHGPRGKGNPQDSLSDFYWIIVEKVNPINTKEEYYSFFPNLIKKLLEIDYKNPFGDNLLRRFFSYYNKYLSDKKNIENDEDLNDFNEKFYSVFNYPFEKIVDAAMKDEYFRKFTNIAGRVPFAIDEMRPDNLGYTDNGELRIIDSSIFGKINGIN